MWETEVPKWGPQEQNPSRGSAGQSPSEAEAKCYTTERIVTFFGTKIQDLTGKMAELT